MKMNAWVMPDGARTNPGCSSPLRFRSNVRTKKSRNSIPRYPILPKSEREVAFLQGLASRGEYSSLQALICIQAIQEGSDQSGNLGARILLQEMTAGYQMRPLSTGSISLKRFEKVTASKTSSSRPQMINVGSFDWDNSCSSHLKRSYAGAFSSSGIQRGQT